MKKIEILQGGRVIDPANHIDDICDIAISEGKILDVGVRLKNKYPGAETLNVTGHVVTPGLIDIHVHVMTGFGDFCLPPDFVGVDSGVTTIVDAGTSSASIFGMARKGVIDSPDTKTRVYALMDPCKIYIATSDFICHKLHIADNEHNLDLGLTREVVAEHKDKIVGFKVRAVATEDGDENYSPFLEGALSVADHLPIMVHFGGFPHTPVIPSLTLINKLRGGDIITHAFRASSGILDEDNQPVPDYVAAYERGVVMDIGHSSGDFHFRTAKHLLSYGYKPTTISTDLNAFNHDGPVFNLTETMSKIWALDLPLSEIIAMTTSQSAKAIHKENEVGNLSIGREADISLLTIEEGNFVMSDGFEDVVCTKRLVAEGCWRKGEWIQAKHRGDSRISTPFKYSEAV